MTRFALSAPMAALLSTGALASPAASPAAAEPMKGRYELRCQDPQTRHWTVAGQVNDPEIVDLPATGDQAGGKPGGRPGGREVRGTGADGQPVVLPMPSDRTCMLTRAEQRTGDRQSVTSPR